MPTGLRCASRSGMTSRSLPPPRYYGAHLPYIPKGPVIDWSQPALCDSFFSQLATYLRKQGALAVRMEPAPESSTRDGELVLKRLHAMRMHPAPAVQPLRTIVLDLAPA